MSQNNSKMYDKRTVDRYVERGDLKREGVESYLKNLPDSGDQAQWVQMDLYEAEMSEGSGADDQDEEETSEEETPEET
jgi:hypothetical protein